MTIPDFIPRELDELGLEVPPEILDRLARFLDLLLTANLRVNLTAVREPDAAWRRLIVDSLTLLPWLDSLPEQATLIDVGSGGGLPGIPVAIARPDLSVTLLEATGKKVRFHQEAVRELHLDNVQPIQERAETLGQQAAHRERYDVAVSRAIGPMPELLEYCLPLVKLGGVAYAMKGPKVEEELERSSDALVKLGGGDLNVHDAYPESFGNDLVIVSVLKDRPTPKAYPRVPGLPRKQPL